jgi:hypothetical protein
MDELPYPGAEALFLSELVRLGDSARGSAHLAPRSPVMKKASPRSMKERRSSERKDFALLFQNRLMGRDRMEQTHVTPGEIAPDALTTF